VIPFGDRDDDDGRNYTNHIFDRGMARQPSAFQSPLKWNSKDVTNVLGLK